VLGHAGKLNIHGMKRKIGVHLWNGSIERITEFCSGVNDYRDFLGVSTDFINDEQLLEFMHETRSASRFIPDEVRRES